MSDHSIRLNDDLDKYIREIGTRETPEMEALRLKSKETLVNSQLAIMPEEANFLQFLVKLTGAKRILELGVYAGYSALAMAQGMPDDGQIIALERDERFPKVGFPYWEQAGVKDKIDVRFCDANEGIELLLKEFGPDSFDMIFIDADKPSYENYYERSLKLVKKGGLICVDNVLWYGRVIDEQDKTRQTGAIREVNKTIKNDPRVDMAMLPVWDGLTLVRKI